MKPWPALASFILLAQFGAHCALFSPLVKIAKPTLIQHSAEYPGGQYKAAHLLDDDPKTEYASNGAGTNTVVEIGFGKTVALAAVRHIDRNDPATVTGSTLELLDESRKTVAVVSIRHANRRQGDTLEVLPEPIRAHGVRWRITGQGAPGLSALGGAGLSFYESGPAEDAPSRSRPVASVLPFLDRSGLQPVTVSIDHLYKEPVEVSLRVGQKELARTTLQPGGNVRELALPEVKSPKSLSLELVCAGGVASSAAFVQAPVRQMTIYITPHSHTDIGYTAIQTDIEKRQVQNLVDGMAAARRTASYPEGSRFVWNVEVGWAADLYLQRMDESGRASFLEAVRNGQVVMNGMYLNELTGLCRPEELLQLFRFSTKMAELTGVPIDSAMISDVPGYTWGTVTAMAQAGIKYFSTAPNYFDRIGTILREWENKPFYWVGPDGKTKVLVWIPFWGYAMSHVYHSMSQRLVAELHEGLEKRDYPYDIAYVRWSGHGDNAVPDPSICEFVRDWNAQYAWPRFIISGTGEAFRALEKRYGSKLPEVRGDWSPYWEDGAGSSALETALNRNTSDKLAAAAAAFAMLKPAEYPAPEFEDAWRKVLLYSEHTWGAWCSVGEPERKETLEQWEIKKSYAAQARRQTDALLQKALAGGSNDAFLQVVNTLSWERSELVSIPAELSRAGDRVIDEQGRPVPSQRLRSGELAFLARKIPPFAARSYSVCAGEPLAPEEPSTASGPALANGAVRLRVDEKSGGIFELQLRGLSGDFVDAASGETLNEYLYFTGDDPSKALRSGPVAISVGEPGPLVASLVVESAAPGAKSLRREIRVVAGAGHAELINEVDKARLQTKSYMANEGKESLNFAFPFKIPGGEMLVDVPFGAFEPESGQMPSACKNWLTAGRWVQIANRERGVTWVTVDAPLLQAGHLSANLLNSQKNPEVWRKKIAPTQKIYSWAMNNHWGTNYRAYQDGPVVFRYVIRPHNHGSDPAEATRFASQFSTPLLLRRGGGPAAPLLRLSNENITVSGMKPSDDGKALIVRLFGASGKNSATMVEWGSGQPKAVYLSDTGEKPVRKIAGKISVPAYGLVTLRAEF